MTITHTGRHLVFIRNLSRQDFDNNDGENGRKIVLRGEVRTAEM